MSFVLLGILNSQAAGGVEAYWLANIGSSGNDRGYAVAFDSSGNIYTAGYSPGVGAGAEDVLLVKYDFFGTVLWQRTLGGISDEEATSLAIDSSGNVYIHGQTESDGAGSRDFLLAKYDSSGTVLWQRVLGQSGNDFAGGIALDSSDNVYMTGGIDFTTLLEREQLLAKYNSSGTIQFQKRLGGGENSANDSGSSVAVDASDNIYVLGGTSSEGVSGDLLLVKYDTSGTIQWQRILGGASSDGGFSVDVDSSGNIYTFGFTQSEGAGNRDLLLAKYNSSGTIQWQRILGGGDYDTGGLADSLAVDSSGNSYFTGWSQSTGAVGRDFIVAKYDTSGTIQWQRFLGGASNDEGYSVAVDSSDNLYIFGDTQSTGEGFRSWLLAKVPSDGSLTGTYSLGGNNITYSASSLTAATSTLTAATSSLTVTTSTLTAGTSTLTAGTPSLTENFVEIGE